MRIQTAMTSICTLDSQNESQHPLPTAPPIYLEPKSEIIILNKTPNSLDYNFPRTPSKVICQYCNDETVTKIEYKSGLASWGICCLCCLCGFWIGCCCVPFFVRDLKNVVHRCGKCDEVIGENLRDLDVGW